MSKIVIIGGGAAGPKVAAKLRRLDKDMIIDLYTDENVISYSACGLPYYVEGLIKLANTKSDKSDVTAFVRGNLRTVASSLKSKGNTSDLATKYHYEDLVQRIEQALDPK